jgi:hypothetical protein
VTLRGEDENWRIGQRREHEEDEHEEDGGGGGGEMVYHSSPSVPGGRIQPEFSRRIRIGINLTTH